MRVDFKLEPGAEVIAGLRRALSDSRVIYYLGFADGSDLPDLENRREELRARRQETATRVASLSQQRSLLMGGGDSEDAVPASMAEFDPLELRDVSGDLAEAQALLARLEGQLAAQSHALPLFRETLKTEGLSRALRTQRDHPVHTLLRRMYHENRS